MISELDFYILAADILTIVISLYWFVLNIKYVVRSSRYVIYAIVFMLYVLPLVLDYVYKFPTYTHSFRLSGFALSQFDVPTRIIYDIGLIFCQWILLYYKRRKYALELKERNYSRLENRTLTNNYTYVIIIGMVFATLLALLFPVPKSILYTFQWRENAAIDVVNKYRYPLEHFAYIGACCSLVFFLDKSKPLNKRIIGLVFLYTNICIQGKRALLFFSLMVLVLMLIPGMTDKTISEEKKKRKFTKLILLIGIFVVVMLLTTINVQTNRSSTLMTTQILYSQTRIDFLRDERVRMAIYSAIHPKEMHILDYPTQTLWPIVTWFFPIDYILTGLGIETLSYQTYFTAALEGLTLTSTSSQMTTCFYAELVSNFGLIGLVLFPIVCFWFAKKADTAEFPMNVMLVTIFMVLQMLSLKYMAYMFEFVLLLNYGSRIRFKIRS